MFNKKKKQSVNLVGTPFTFHIENSSDKSQEFILFGSSLNLCKPNFGNNNSISVSYIDGSDDFKNGYASILNDLLYDSWIVGGVRLQSQSVANLTQKLYFVNQTQYSTDTTSQGTYQDFVDLSTMRNVNQFQSDILAFNCKFKVNKRIFIKGTILANSIISITVYPTKINSNLFYEEYSHAKSDFTLSTEYLDKSTKRIVVLEDKHGFTYDIPFDNTIRSKFKVFFLICAYKVLNLFTNKYGKVYKKPCLVSENSRDSNPF